MKALHWCALTGVCALAGAASGTAQAAEVVVDQSTRHQTIDGFGFFGAHDVWWSSDDAVVDDAWVQFVINDLGLSIWRNEYYPPGDAISGQDADWDKQRPVAESFRDQAAASGVPLKTILTVWSPPAEMKCRYENDVVYDGEPHPEGTKGGGALCPSRRADFAQWLVAGLDLYAAIGMDVYALSFQNEPLFEEPYNSCVYSQQLYAETLAEIGPIVRAAHPNVKLFGSENMLAIECGRDGDQFDPWWYTANVIDNSDALAQLDIWAVHGYSDGVTATASSRMSTLWTNFLGGVASTQRPVWMTETSGYVDTWEKGPNDDGDETQGAMDLAQAIYAGLRYGDMGAWVWWQGSELGTGSSSQYSLMGGTEYMGKRYYVSKNFYRYIRPGAQRVDAASDDPDVLVVAFEHPALESLTLVVINAADGERSLAVSGANVPAQFEVHRSSASEDCDDLGPADADSMTLPARSVTTLTHGSYNDVDVPTAGTGGTGGAGATGGFAGTAGSAVGGGAGGEVGGAGGTSGSSGGPSVGGQSGAGASSGSGGSGFVPPTGGAAGGGDYLIPPGSGGASGSDGGSPTGGRGGEAGASSGAGATSGTTDNRAGDAGNGGEPTAASDRGSDDGGCGCRVSSSRAPASSLATMLALLGVAAGIRRRERRRRR